MKKKLNPIIIISVVTGILLAVLVGILVFFNLPAQRIRRMLKTANKYIAEENYEEAILTLQKILEIDPKNEELYILLADTYEKNGDIDKEVELLREAVTLMPENSKISEVLLDVYPDVTLSENSGTYSDPVSLSMSSPEGSEIFYKFSGSNKESKYSSPIDFGKNGEYTIEYYAISKNGYEGEHKTATYVIKLDESKYHFNEWVDEADGRHYYDADGVSVTGWQQLGGLWYLFDKTGVMFTGLQDDKGKTYYLGTDGIMLTGWQEINGKKYYFDESGAMLKNQWIDDTYYVGADGAMLVDTKTPDGKKVGKDGKKIDEAWKQAYIDLIKGGNYRDNTYDEETIETINDLYEYPECFWNYTYINEDSIPELILGYDTGMHGYYYLIFTYCNDGVHGVAERDTSYKERENLIVLGGGLNQIHYKHSYAISPEGFIPLHSALSNIQTNELVIYTVDGTDVSEDQYDNLCKQFFYISDMEYLSSEKMPDKRYSNEEMINIIKNM